MDIIRELWYGNVSPFKQSTRGDKQLEELLKLVARNQFYERLTDEGLKGTSMQRYHSVLHLAFKSAFKRRILPANPVDQADRPKAQQYIADYYNPEEIKKLLEVSRDDELHLIILLACFYGLRRSEITGLFCSLRSNPFLYSRKAKRNADWRPVLLWRRERDSFLTFARRFGYYLLLRRAKIFGHRSQNNALCCFAHCVRIPVYILTKKQESTLK